MTNHLEGINHISNNRPVADPEQEAIYQAQMQEMRERLAVEAQRTEERIAEIEYAPILQAIRYEQIMAEANASPLSKLLG
jgi:hypothetical protein